LNFSKRQFPILVIAIFLLDQLVKYYFLYSGAPIQKNTGVAFGLLQEGSYLVLLILFILIILIFFMLTESNIFPMSMVVGGGLSNLVDRLLRGYVIDYLFLDPLPVFNLGDVAVALGVFLLIYGFRSSEKARP